MLAEPDRTRADLSWKMMGIPVRIHPLFWLVAIVFGYELFKVSFDMGLVWVAVLLFTTLVHELGHALTARYFGSRSVRIVLYSLGGLAIHDHTGARWQRILISFMGPGIQLLLALVVWLVGLAIGIEHFTPLVAVAYSATMWVCVIWALVNLVPVYPLDGGQILVELCRARRPHDGMLLGLRLSMIVGGVVTALCLLAYVMGWSGSKYVIGLFLVLSLLSWMQLKQIEAQGYGGGDDRMPHEREPWEADPDAWKGR